jgi:hypothetical protein
MANPVILEYLEKYYRNYNLKDLKNKIISTGYSVEEVEEAVNELGIGWKESVNQEINSNNMYEDANSPKSKGSIWFKIGAISGIVFLFFFFLSILLFFLFSEIIEILIIVLILGGICLILFFYGFVCLGKKYGEGLLKVAGWMLIIMEGLLIMFHLAILFFPKLVGDVLFGNLFDSLISGNSGDILSIIASLGILFAILVILFLFYFIMFILFGVGLIKLKKESNFAKITGILTIIGTVALLFGLGILVLLVVFVFGIILLFKESKNY